LEVFAGSCVYFCAFLVAPGLCVRGENQSVWVKFGRKGGRTHGTGAVVVVKGALDLVDGFAVDMISIGRRENKENTVPSSRLDFVLLAFNQHDIGLDTVNLSKLVCYVEHCQSLISVSVMS
jgi:hypothetical protein